MYKINVQYLLSLIHKCLSETNISNIVDEVRFKSMMILVMYYNTVFSIVQVYCFSVKIVI